MSVHNRDVRSCQCVFNRQPRQHTHTLQEQTRISDAEWSRPLQMTIRSAGCLCSSIMYQCSASTSRPFQETRFASAHNATGKHTSSASSLDAAAKHRWKRKLKSAAEKLTPAWPRHLADAATNRSADCMLPVPGREIHALTSSAFALADTLAHESSQSHRATLQSAALGKLVYRVNHAPVNAAPWRR